MSDAPTVGEQERQMSQAGHVVVTNNAGAVPLAASNGNLPSSQTQGRSHQMLPPNRVDQGSSQQGSLLAPTPIPMQWAPGAWGPPGSSVMQPTHTWMPHMNPYYSNVSSVLSMPAHVPATPTFVGKSKRGRPVGSCNKAKKKKEDGGESADADYKPPARRTYRTSPYLPRKKASDALIPQSDHDCCNKCGLFGGILVLRPCGDYSLCYSCVEQERDLAGADSRDEKCPLCGMRVEHYLRGIRVSFRDVD